MVDQDVKQIYLALFKFEILPDSIFICQGIIFEGGDQMRCLFCRSAQEYILGLRPVDEK